MKIFADVDFDWNFERVACESAAEDYTSHDFVDGAPSNDNPTSNIVICT